MTTFLVLAACAITLLYAGAPILIRQSLTLKGRPRCDYVDVDDMPAEVYGYFGEIAAGMATCGFTIALYIRNPDLVPNVVGYVALWVNRSTGQTATTVVMYATAGGQVRVTCYTEFMTKAADGMCVLTNNSKSIGSFKRVPMKDTLYAEGVNDVQHLYRLHLSRENRLILPTSPRYIPKEGEELSSFADGIEFDLRRQAKVGYLWEASPAVFRPTWVGAYMMTWCELPPVKQIRRMFARSRAWRELREAERRPVTPPRNVPITHVSPYRSAP